MSRRIKLPSFGKARMVFGDAEYRVEAFIDIPWLMTQLGQTAAWSKGGRSQALNGAVVVTAKQANVAPGGG